MKFARWLNAFADSGLSAAIANNNATPSQSGLISLAAGLPSSDLFPTEALAEAFAQAIRDDGETCLQYGPSQGQAALRTLVCDLLASRGIAANPEDVLITTGSQQALDLIAKLLINRGDRVLVEAPTYLGALQAFNVFGAEYVTATVTAVTRRMDGMLDTVTDAGDVYRSPAVIG